MTFKRDLVPGIVLAIASIIYFAFTFQIDIFKGSGSTPLDSRFMPRLWAVMLLILSLNLIRRGLKTRMKEAAAGTIHATAAGTFKKSLINNREIVFTFVLLAFYIAGLGSIGFLIMTALYLFFQVMVLTQKEKRNVKMAAIVAIVTSVLVDYIFVVWLNVLLPQGLFGF